jgi:transcriptional regulator with XRE-family HTH domain
MDTNLVEWSHKPKSHYQELASELIRELRGELSQRDLSQKLGYSFNQVGKWEALATQIKFSDFIKICKVLDFPIENQFRRYFYTLQGPFTEENILESLKTIISRSHVDVSFFKSPRPDFSEFLEILDLCPSHLIAWLSEIIDCSKINLIKPVYNFYLSRLELVKSYPMAPFIYTTLELESYKVLPEHSDEFMAYHAGCTQKDVRLVLGFLQQFGWVIFADNKYQKTCLHFGFSTIASESLRGMTKYATDLASNRYSLTRANIPQGSNVGQSSFRAMALSYEASLRARELILQFHNDLAELEKFDSGEKNNIQVFVAHSFPTTVNANPEDYPSFVDGYR